MQPSNRFAFKEWAAVCAALEAGRQMLILRKGGIHEGRDGFRVEHREFWLFPTRFHQATGELVEDARPLLDQALGDRPPDGLLRLRQYAVVEQVIRIRDERQLPALEGLHVLSTRTVTERFHYREPGLFVLPVRVYRRCEPLDVPDSPHFAGCRSWVDLPDELPTAGLEPVLSEGAFQRELNRIRRALAPTEVA